MEAEEFIRRVAIFKYLDQTALGHLASKLELVSLTEGPLMTEADPVDCLYIIKSGTARVTKVTDSGEQVVLAELKRGDSFGELALIDGLGRSAEVTAMQPMECYMLPHEAFLDAIDLYPGIAKAMLPVLAGMVREANKRVAGGG